MDASYWIGKLDLKPHPEGGWFREVYRSGLVLNPDDLPGQYDGDRSICTSVYFLLQSGNFSAFHRLRSDELWHFYAGAPLKVYRITPCGELKTSELSAGGDGNPFLCIPRNNWFAAEVAEEDAYTLIGCTVSPGFDFADFELADRDKLSEIYPHYAALISRLTRG